MRKSSKRPDFEFWILFFFGIFIFLCGIVLFALKHRNTSFYFYSLSLCILGMVFVMISMLEAIKRNRKTALKSTVGKGCKRE